MRVFERRHRRAVGERTRVADGNHRWQHGSVDQPGTQLVGAQSFTQKQLHLGTNVHPLALRAIQLRELAAIRKARYARAQYAHPELAL